MVLYIDKENVISMVRSEDKASYIEYAALVRKHMDIQYNFPKEEIKSNEYLRFWFSQLGSGVEGNHTFCPPQNVVPERPMKANFYNSIDANGLSSIFFLDDERKVSAVAERCCVIVAKVGEELAKLREVFALDDKSEELSYQINSWNEFLPKLPLTDLIICDNYYFKDKYIYEANNNEIIRVLSAIPKNSPINIVIIVKERAIDSEIDLETEQVKIKEFVKQISGSTKSTVTILTTYAIHDRTLITNYYRVKHGCGFHIKANNIKKDITTEIKIHAIRQNHDVTKKLLSEYQKIAHNPSNCIGDKICNYLKFN